MTTYSLQHTGNRSCSVILAGDLTASSVPGLQAELKQQLVSGTDELVFDLAATAILDSSGIGLLIAAANSLGRQSGRVRVLNASPEICQLLQSMRLTHRLNVSGRAA